MNFLRHYWEIVLIVFALVFHHSIGLTTFYATDFCRTSGSPSYGTINLGSTSRGSNSSAILKAARTFSYPLGNLNCNITILAPIYHGVVVSIRKIDFRFGCSESIQIVDARGGSTSFCDSIYNFNSATSVSSTGKMTVVFKTGYSFASVTVPDEFELTLTAYTNTPCSSGSDEYRCSNYRCISKFLTCDDRNHCGDSSDNYECDYVSPVGKIVGSVFGTTFLIIAIIGLIICCRNRRNRIVTTTVVHQPPPPQYVQQPYPGSYPPPQYMAGPPPHGEAVNPLYR